MLDTLARMLGLSRTAAEESLHSERAARHVLTRRDAFGLAGAMCSGFFYSELDPRGFLFTAHYLQAAQLGERMWFAPIGTWPPLYAPVVVESVTGPGRYVLRATNWRLQDVTAWRVLQSGLTPPQEGRLG